MPPAGPLGPARIVIETSTSCNANEMGVYPRGRAVRTALLRLSWSRLRHGIARGAKHRLPVESLTSSNASRYRVAHRPARLPHRTRRIAGAQIGCPSVGLPGDRGVVPCTVRLDRGPGTGAGTSWLACALAHYACRRGRSAYSQRMPRLGEELRIRHRTFGKWLIQLAKTDVLLLDDWGMAGWMLKPDTTCWRSLTTGRPARRPSSPASCRSNTGTPGSATPRSPTQSSTG